MEPMADAEKVAAMRDAATNAWKALCQLDDRYHNGDYRWALNAVGRLANTLSSIASAPEPPAQMTLDDWLLEFDG